MTLTEALNKSRIAVLDLGEETYFATHTAMYKENATKLEVVRDFGYIAILKDWRPMGDDSTTS